MKMLFDEHGRMVATEYFSSEDYQTGRPCCAVREGIWHLLLPDRCPLLPSTRRMYAMPFSTKSEPEGWQWRLIIPKGWNLKLPCRCFAPPAPSLPNYGDEYEARLIIYGFLLPGLNHAREPAFGIEEPLQILFQCSLRVVRVTASERLARGGQLPRTYN